MDATRAAEQSTFPVNWNTIEVTGPPFAFDPMHAPHPISPLQQTVGKSAFRNGYSRAMREFGIGMRENRSRFVNYYAYGRMVFDIPDDAEQARATIGEIEEAIQRETGRMMERWHGEHLPQIRRDIERLLALDLHGATAGEAAGQLNELNEILTDLWTIHFRIAIPMLVSVQVFSELHTDLFGGTAADAQALLVGAVTGSIRAAFGLSDLAEAARDLGLEPVFRTSPDETLLDDLRTAAGGEAFLERLSRYLAEFGYRQDLFELTTPTWREDPMYALRAVRSYLLSGYDARADLARVSQSAHDALEEARRSLSGYPEPVCAQYEAMLEHARQGAFLQEEHNFELDQHLSAGVRLACLGLGQRLVDAGVLDRAEGIFMLRLVEVHEVAFDIEPWRHAARVRALVARRSSEMEIARTLTPPMMLGSPQATGGMPDSPIGRAMNGFFGGPPPEQTVFGQIRGHAGSRGIYTGVARVARSLEEAGSLREGEVLVAVTTMPAWTPLFGIAGAIVTETGGPLSHCAIVAREYGVPAVVGAPGATTTIVTGQRIGVDGDRGIVMIEG